MFKTSHQSVISVLSRSAVISPGLELNKIWWKEDESIVDTLRILNAKSCFRRRALELYTLVWHQPCFGQPLPLALCFLSLKMPESPWNILLKNHEKQNSENMQMLKTARRANEFLTFYATSRVYSCSVKRKDRCEGCPSGQKAFYGLWKTRLESHQQSPPIGYHTKVCLPTCSLKDCTHAPLLRHDCQRWNGLSCPDNESNIWLKV